MTSFVLKIKHIRVEMASNEALASIMSGDAHRQAKFRTLHPVHKLILHPTAGQSGVTVRQGRAGHQRYSPHQLSSHHPNPPTCEHQHHTSTTFITSLFRAQTPQIHFSTPITFHPPYTASQWLSNSAPSPAKPRYRSDKICSGSD
jgi:hypothetical protein